MKMEQKPHIENDCQNSLHKSGWRCCLLLCPNVQNIRLVVREQSKFCSVQNCWECAKWLLHSTVARLASSSLPFWGDRRFDQWRRGSGHLHMTSANLLDLVYPLSHFKCNFTYIKSGYFRTPSHSMWMSYVFALPTPALHTGMASEASPRWRSDSESDSRI